LSAVFLFVFRKKFSLAIERSFFPEAYISKRDEKKQSKGEWKDSRNYMINKTILAESREKGLFFDPGLIIGTAFSIMMSVAWSLTTDKDGNLLSSVEILGMSVTVYAFFLGALFENKTLQQELSFDFLKLVPEKWYRKLLNILAIPFAKAAICILTQFPRLNTYRKHLLVWF
ncbi:MAG: putative ABC exporter domain-containing protein, partial [Bifidobacteriaceae bacterium]|nr:putative ABC exporter domain-containing protein [Bifidobacteriaceae bacterium]